MKLSLGRKVSDVEQEFFLDLPINKTTTPNRNLFMIATQGSGKTNLLMLLASSLFTIWRDTENKHGALPIIFAPTYEFKQIEVPSKDVNLPPGFIPSPLPCVHITFPCCDPVEDETLNICSFDFSKFDAMDVLGFTDISEEDSCLGAIKKLIERIKNGYYKGKGKNKVWIPPVEFNLDNFIEEVKEDNQLKDALYYVFTEMREIGMFDNEKYPVIDFKKYLKEKKPIIIHFGDLDDRHKMSGISGIILKELWNISKIYYNAYLKNQKGTALDEFEKFLLENWTIALLMEEAHQILYATRSGGMALESKHPSHYWFKKITQLMGRKRGFKYSLIVTQKFKEIFYGIRITFDDLILGGTIYPDDKAFLEEDLKIKRNHINRMTALPKFSWAFVNIDKYQKRKKKCISKVNVYLSPAGQPV